MGLALFSNYYNLPTGLFFSLMISSASKSVSKSDDSMPMAEEETSLTSPPSSLPAASPSPLASPPPPPPPPTSTSSSPSTLTSESASSSSSLEEKWGLAAVARKRIKMCSLKFHPYLFLVTMIFKICSTYFSTEQHSITI